METLSVNSFVFAFAAILAGTNNLYHIRSYPKAAAHAAVDLQCWTL